MRKDLKFNTIWLRNSSNNNIRDIYFKISFWKIIIWKKNKLKKILSTFWWEAMKEWVSSFGIKRSIAVLYCIVGVIVYNLYENSSYVTIMELSWTVPHSTPFLFTQGNRTEPNSEWTSALDKSSHITQC